MLAEPLTSSSTSRAASALVALGTAAVFAPVLYHFTYVDPVDFGPHLEFARRMWSAGRLNQPHFLFHPAYRGVAVNVENTGALTVLVIQLAKSAWNLDSALVGLAMAVGPVGAAAGSFIEARRKSGGVAGVGTDCGKAR